jgi:dUTP pyrophosphatase
MESTILVRRLDNYPADWSLPEYGTAGAAAADLRNAGDTVTLQPMQRILIPTGLAIAIPDGMEVQIRPRSGLALRQGISIINTPCTIDSDYRGELRVPMINFDSEPQTLAHGERIAQMLVAQVVRIAWAVVDELPPSGRGEGGFGSTGRKSSKIRSCHSLPHPIAAVNLLRFMSPFRYDAALREFARRAHPADGHST